MWSVQAEISLTCMLASTRILSTCTCFGLKTRGKKTSISIKDPNLLCHGKGPEVTISSKNIIEKKIFIIFLVISLNSSCHTNVQKKTREKKYIHLQTAGQMCWECTTGCIILDIKLCWKIYSGRAIQSCFKDTKPRSFIRLADEANPHALEGA